MATDEALAAGILAFREHRLEIAKTRFAQAVVANPNSEEAWLWLARVIDHPQHRSECHQRVLEINPRNAEAAQAFQYFPSLDRPISVPQSLAIGNPPPTHREAPPRVAIPRRTVSIPPGSVTQPQQRITVSGYILLNLMLVLAILSLYFLVMWFNVSTQVQNAALTPASVVTRALAPTANRSAMETPTRAASSVAQTTGSRAAADLFAEVQMALDSERPQKALESLLPNLPKFTDGDDLREAYFYLGRAELDLENYPAAAGYFQELYALDPSMENLFVLAISNDLAGNLAAALENYSALATANGKQSALYRGLAERRISDIKRLVDAQPSTVK